MIEDISALMELESLIDFFEQLEPLMDNTKHPLDDESKLVILHLTSILHNTKQDSILSTDEITDIGELGLSFIEGLFLDMQATAETLTHFNKMAMAFAFWVAQQGGALNHLDYPVNALASTANTIHDKTRLEALYEIAAYMVSASTESVKASTDKTSGNPWRVLVMNYSIIATRTHNPDLMNSAFKTLLQYFPESAPGFFKQGMSEMIRLNYPQHVRVIVGRYFEQYTSE